MAPRFVPNPAEINRLLHGAAGPVYQYVNAFGRQVEAQAKRTSPVDTGLLRASTLASPINVGPAGLSLTVGSGLFYAVIVHQGHGPIRPVRASALRFYWKRVGKFVVTQYVNPVAGRPYIWDALVVVNNRQLPDRQFVLTRINPSPLIT